MKLGDHAQATFPVRHEDTALEVGSGDLLVLGTPRLLAFMEAVTVQAVTLPEDRTSVGTRVDLAHLAASTVGREVTVTATLTDLDGRTLTFTVEAIDDRGTQVGRATVERVVVDRARFLARLA